MRRIFFIILISSLLGIAASLCQAESADSGSIKFTPLETITQQKKNKMSLTGFTSVSADDSSGFTHLRFAFEAEEAWGIKPEIDIKKAAQKFLEYFFIGLAVPEENFWVNLSPYEPNRVIDSLLSDTDPGRIMLGADLRLKKDASEFTNPKISKTGKQFWSRLYEKAEQFVTLDSIPVSSRLWIVPDEVIVYETENQIFIIKSRLRVCLESAYLSDSYNIKDRRERELEDFASGLMQELVLPHLNERVNEGGTYADLKEVYQALILAKCYKEKFGYRSGYFLRRPAVEILEDAEINFPETPQQLYRNYLKSLKQGEYSFMETLTQGFSFYQVVSVRQYFSGGVDFRNIKIKKTNKPIQSQTQKDKTYLTCDLFIPHGVKRPLEYAKNQLEVTTDGGSRQKEDVSIALAGNLPAISPVKFFEQRMQVLDSTDRADKIVLSRL